MERILRAQLEGGGDAYLRAPAPPAAFRDKFKIVPVTTETKEVSLKKRKLAIGLLMAKGETSAELHSAAQEGGEHGCHMAWVHYRYVCLPESERVDLALERSCTRRRV